MINWKSPDYAPVWAERKRRLEHIRANKGEFHALQAHYVDHPVDFINDWVITFDPRNVEIGLPALVPFILFDRQKDYINWLFAKWKNREDGLAEKSRDMGVSWLSCAFSIWIWLYYTGVVVGVGSRKEDYVDKIGDPKTLFWKMRQIINYLPKEFKPDGWDDKKHAPYMRIINPANESSIIGEAGDNIGRGARTSIYLKDEAQPHSAKILTPTGWSTMGDMVVGSLVIGADGSERSVTHINECGDHPVYRIGFTDGTSTECSYNHLWKVIRKIGKDEELILCTHEIADNFIYISPQGQTQYLYSVPICDSVKFSNGCDLPIHPYIIGALLGDGCVSEKKSSTELTTSDLEIVQVFVDLLPEGVEIKSTGSKYGYRISGTDKRHEKNNIFKTKLLQSGIYGMLSGDKHIPDSYLYSSIDNRISLLQGLMDTDGSASGSQTTYHTTSKKLAENVRFLVQSLGGLASLTVKPDHRGFKPVYVLTIMIDNGMQLFRLKRKLSNVRTRKNAVLRTINSVEYIGHKTVRCVTVDNDDGLYLTDHCIVTHNSAFFEHPDSIDAALSQTSNCKIDISTPNGAGNPFYRKRHSGKVSVFVFDWRDDPRKDDAWYQKQVEQHDPVIVAQEIDRDYEASISDAFIPGILVSDAMAKGPADVEGIGYVQYALDVARFGNDKTVLTCRQGRVVYWQKAWAKVDTEDTVGRVVSEIKAFKKPDQIAIDVIGVGAGVVDKLKRLYDDDIVVEVNSANRVDDGMNYNLRAKMWDDVREWLKNGPVSLPNSSDLKSDLTALRYFFKGGLRLMESKDDAKKRGIKSPDYADSLCLTFAEPVKKKKRRTPIVQPFEPSVAGMGY